MNYANIKYVDIANGVGCRTTLFVSGCRRHCPGCFNPEAQEFAYGEAFTAEVEEALLASLEPRHITGITLLGGEPFEPENQAALLPFLHRVREAYPEKTVWAYSGFTFEELTAGEGHAEHTCELLSLIDVLVDGAFILEQKDITLRFRGSANQRLLDVQKSLEAGKAVTWRDDPVFATHAMPRRKGILYEA